MVLDRVLRGSKPRWTVRPWQTGGPQTSTEGPHVFLDSRSREALVIVHSGIHVIDSWQEKNKQTSLETHFQKRPPESLHFRTNATWAALSIKGLHGGSKTSLLGTSCSGPPQQAADRRTGGADAGSVHTLMVDHQMGSCDSVKRRCEESWSPGP